MKLAEDNATPAKPHRSSRRLRTIAVLPTMLTLANMLCGFAAVYLCMLGLIDAFTGVGAAAKTTLNRQMIEDLLPTYVSVGGVLIFLGMFFDGMDGRVARMTTGTTNFGGQLDSLADMITFGIAPAMLVIVMILTGHHEGLEGPFVKQRFAWVAGAIYVSCCGLRLARFNVEHAEGDLKHTRFYGLPSPGAAALVASMVILHEHVADVRGEMLVNSLPVITVVAGLLMVSRVQYVHIGNTYLRGRKPWGYVVLMVLVAGTFIAAPSPTLAGIVAIYVLSGPINTYFKKKRKSTTEGKKQDTDSSGMGQSNAAS
ncbi:MAG: CDP-diacylglycerol--serine O-phosphatidyltransferase [Phycisphaerae bacterium]|nr:MAG: CDP-diacylglycerol--serine O-phosphatidyltransferase [Phycisphaerae bacterium]